jgi:hypothetical protein
MNGEENLAMTTVAGDEHDEREQVRTVGWK